MGLLFYVEPWSCNKETSRKKGRSEEITGQESNIEKAEERR